MRNGSTCVGRIVARVVGSLLLLLLLQATPTFSLEWEPALDSEAPVTCAATRPDAGTYVGAGEFVFRLGDGPPTEVLARAGHEVSALFVDEDGTLFVGWDDGVWRLAPDAPDGWDSWDWVALGHGFVSAGYHVTERGPMGPIACIARAPIGVVAASRTQGALSFGQYYRLWDTYWAHFWGPNSEWLDLREVFGEARINHILQDDNGDLWFGTDHGVLLVAHGVAAYHKRRSGYYSRGDNSSIRGMEFRWFGKESHALPDDEVLCVAVQRPGGTWFGFGDGGGVARCPLPGRPVEHFSTALGQWTVQLTQTGGHLRTDEWQVTRPGESGLPAGPVRSLAADGDDRLWAAIDIPGSDPPQSKLAWLGGNEWRPEPPPVVGRAWPRIHQLLVTDTGELLLCTAAGAWKAAVTPLSHPIQPVAEWPSLRRDAAEPADLPEARAVAPGREYTNATELLNAVVERNRPWLLPPTDQVDSLEYRFLLTDQPVEQHFCWERPYASRMQVIWDRRGLVPDLVGRRWITHEPQAVSEVSPGGGVRPLSRQRFDPGPYWQGCLSGCELQTALRLYARRPDQFELSLSEADAGAGERRYLVGLHPAERGRDLRPYAVPRLFMVAWTYALEGPWRAWTAVVTIDGNRLVPLGEEWIRDERPLDWRWYGEVKPKERSYDVAYSDFRETPDGTCVPLSVWVGRYARDDDGRPLAGGARLAHEHPSFHAQYAWYEPGLWLLSEATMATEDGASKAEVRGVRVNDTTGLAEDLREVEEEVLTRRAQALDLLADVAERNSPWLSPEVSPDFLEASYVFQLRGPEGELADLERVNTTAGELRRWHPFMLGNTLTLLIEPVTNDPLAFSPILVDTREEDGRRVHVIHVETPEPVRMACGNGLRGTWHGYSSGRWQELECVIDAETLLPVRAKARDWEQQYGDFQEVAPGKFAPMLIRMPGRWEYRFIWANECLWIAKETFSGAEREGQRACGRLVNLMVNGQPVDGIPVLSDEQVRAAETELAAAEEQRRKERERE
jgi:hypothetical protein